MKHVTPTELHFDYLNGDNSNAGYSKSTALKTVTEYIDRQVKYPFYQTRLDVYIHGDMGPDDICFFPKPLFGNGYIFIHFVPNADQILHIGTLTGFVNFDIATNQESIIEDSGVDFTPFIGRYVVIQNASGTVYCKILKALASGVARVGYFAAVDPTDTFGNMMLLSPSIGDSYQIVQLPKCYHYMEDGAPADQTGGGAFANGVPKIVEFGDFSQCGYPTILGNSWNGPTLFRNCDVSVKVIGDASLQNCISQNLAIYQCLASVAQFHDYLNVSYFPIIGNLVHYGAIFQNSQLVMNSTVNLPTNSSVEFHHGAYGVGVFDSYCPFVLEEGGTLLLESQIWGHDNSGPIVSLNNGGRCLIDSESHTNPILATTTAPTEIEIDGMTSLPAWDPSTTSYTSPRLLTSANFIADIASGGFDNGVFNPGFPATCMGSKS
jgi:hypothetical protein